MLVTGLQVERVAGVTETRPSGRRACTVCLTRFRSSPNTRFWLAVASAEALGEFTPFIGDNMVVDNELFAVAGVPAFDHVDVDTVGSLLLYVIHPGHHGILVICDVGASDQRVSQDNAHPVGMRGTKLPDRRIAGRVPAVPVSVERPVDPLIMVKGGRAFAELYLGTAGQKLDVRESPETVAAPCPPGVYRAMGHDVRP